MNTALTNREEIADIIFNSDNPELKIMLQRAMDNNYEIPHLMWSISVDINSHFGESLAKMVLTQRFTSARCNGFRIRSMPLKETCKS